ncbi:hypothetical protein L211DRAFT_870085 [Terfezia boudieri ATCC MYA-4762]|uniref:Uncharacterized protein n=1 Tax=Terfezia boudieri ATCC MYA-4762 TaxID=1051890 RepID=A0A3N4LTA2_9PEZI|nr:hypothetical protein L211DRAFT_870085 [Terfezia boudieri ATCC MYA-4762]
MLVQPVWTWIIQTLIALVWGKVSPQPINEFTEKLLFQLDELQKKLNEERERGENAEKALAEMEKARAVWEEKHQGKVERGKAVVKGWEEVVRMWQERFQADEAKADKVKTALEEELRIERECVVELGKENTLLMRMWQWERERVQDLAKNKENDL